jgi:DNA-directed RNA polymerase specialized sigma24 family protein
MSGRENRRLFELEVLPELDVVFTAASSLVHDADQASDFCEKTMVRAYQSFDPSGRRYGTRWPRSGDDWIGRE